MKKEVVLHAYILRDEWSEEGFRTRYYHKEYKANEEERHYTGLKDDGVMIFVGSRLRKDMIDRVKSSTSGNMVYMFTDKSKEEEVKELIRGWVKASRRIAEHNISRIERFEEVIGD